MEEEGGGVRGMRGSMPVGWSMLVVHHNALCSTTNNVVIRSLKTLGVPVSSALHAAVFSWQLLVPRTLHSLPHLCLALMSSKEKQALLFPRDLV